MQNCTVPGPGWNVYNESTTRASSGQGELEAELAGRDPTPRPSTLCLSGLSNLLLSECVSSINYRDNIFWEEDLPVNWKKILGRKFSEKVVSKITGKKSRQKKMAEKTLKKEEENLNWGKFYVTKTL